MSITNPDFGDFDADDALDTAPPDPTQVAYRIHRLRRYLSQLAGDDIGSFFDMTEDEQTAAINVGEDIVAWVITHDPSDTIVSPAKYAMECGECGVIFWILRAVTCSAPRWCRAGSRTRP